MACKGCTVGRYLFPADIAFLPELLAVNFGSTLPYPRAVAPLRVSALITRHYLWFIWPLVMLLPSFYLADVFRDITHLSHLVVAVGGITACRPVKDLLIVMRNILLSALSR